MSAPAPPEARETAPRAGPRGAPSRFGVRLAVVTAGALVLRVVWVLAFRRDQPLKGDDFYYHWQARALADGLGFVNPFSWQGLDRLDPTAAHPPLYPLVLALPSKLGLDTPLAHRLVSAGIGAAAVLVVGLVGRRIAGARAGLLAAGAAALSPSLWINDGMLVSESLYALLVAALLLAAQGLWARRTWPGAAVLGAMIGLAALTRPEAILFLPLLGVPLLLSRSGSWRDRLVVVGALGVTCTLVITPWVARNLVKFQEPVLLASGHGSVLQIGNCDSTYSGPLLGYWDIRCTTAARPPRNERQRRLLEGSKVPGLVYLIAQDERDESIADRRARSRGLSYIRHHLRRAPVVAAARVGRVWEVYRPGQGIDLDVFFERRGRWPSRLGLAMYYVLAGLSVYGLVVMRRRRVPLWPMLSVFVLTTFTVAISIGITRYRVGADVALAALGGVGLDALLPRRPAAPADEAVRPIPAPT